MSNFICPHCQAVLEIPEELANRKVECPVCKKVFTAIIEDAQTFSVNPGKFRKNSTVNIKNKSENTVAFSKYAWKSRYHWGYLYVRFCQVIAILIIVALMIKTIIIIDDTVSKQQQRYKTLLNNAAVVNRMQSEFEQRYNQAVIILKSSNNTPGSIFNHSGEEVVNGFSLTSDVVDPDISFNMQLSSTKKIKKSLSAVEKYRQSLNKIESIVQNDLTRHLEKLGKIVSRLQNKNHSKTVFSLKQNRSSSIILERNSIRDFYQEESLIEQKLIALLAAIDRNSDRLKNERLEKDMLDFRKYLKFISENLLSNKEVHEISGHQGAELPQNDNTPSRQKQFVEVFYEFLMQNLPDLYNSGNWKVSLKLDLLQRELENLYNQAEQHEVAKRTEYKTMVLAICLQWLIFLLSILGIMVLADFLRAHFDNAYNSFN